MANSTYYQERLKAFRFLEEQLRQQKGKWINVHALLYILTSKFELGEKSIEKRLVLMEKIGHVELEEDRVKWIA